MLARFAKGVEDAYDAAAAASWSVTRKSEVIQNDLAKGLTTKKREGWNKRFYLLMVDVRTIAKTCTHNVEVLRTLTDAAGIPAGAMTPSGIKTETVQAGGVRSMWCWPSTFDKASDVPVKLLYIHGGAFCLGSPETHKQLACQLAKRSQAAVLVPDYRRCPEHTISDAHADILAVYRWMRTDGDALAAGAESTHGDMTSTVLLGGESAGANLALGVALKLRSGELGLPQANGLLLMSPWADLKDAVEQVNPSWAENESNDFVLGCLASTFSRWVLTAQKLGGVPEPSSKAAAEQLASLDQAALIEVASSEEVSPALAKNLRGLPPALITTGECETLRDSQILLAKRLSDAGVTVEHVIYPDMPHAFVLVNFASSSTCTAPSDVLDKAASFISAWMVDGEANHTAALTNDTGAAGYPCTVEGVLVNDTAAALH